jgi:hypothetical protein
MKLRLFPNEAVNITGYILLIVELACKFIFGIEAKGVIIISEENGVAIMLQPATKCSGLCEHLENTD